MVYLKKSVYLAETLWYSVNMVSMCLQQTVSCTCRVNKKKPCLNLYNCTFFESSVVLCMSPIL